MDFITELTSAAEEIKPGDITIDGYRTVNVNREAGFELPKEQFLDIFAGKREIHTFPHSGVDATGYLFEVLHVNIFAATFTWLVDYEKDNEEIVVVAKDYVNKAKGRCRLFGTAREINEAAGKPIGIVLTVGGTNSGNLLDIIGQPNNYRTGLFYRQIVEPTEILLNETGKMTLPLDRWYIPLEVGEANEVTSKKTNKTNWIRPIKPGWTSRDASEIKKAKNASSLKDSIVSHLFLKGDEYKNIRETLLDEANRWVDEQNQFIESSMQSEAGQWLQFVSQQRLRLDDPIGPLRANSWNVQNAIEAVTAPVASLPAGGNGGQPVVSAMSYASKGNEFS